VIGGASLRLRLLPVMGITGNSCFPTAEWKSLIVRSPLTDRRSLTNLGVFRTTR